MTQQPEIPEGWERRGEFLFRQHDGSFATIWQDGDGDWAATVATLGDSAASESWEATLPATVAWANSQLGVPKPVEVVEVEHSDAWMLWSEQTGKSFRVSKSIMCRDYVDEDVAMSKAREYVRGAQ